MWSSEEKRDLLKYLLIAMVPVLLLAAFFPQRLLREPRKIEALYSVPGAELVVFYQQDCPHCHELRRYARQQGWDVEYHEVTTPEGQELFTKLKKRVKGLARSVPTIIVNGKISQGYKSNETTGAWIGKVLASCQATEEKCLSFTSLLEEERRGLLISSGLAGVDFADSTQVDDRAASDYRLNVFLFGEVDLTALSLPVLAVLLGFLDGFNPCAMWVLVSLLTLLFALKDIRKMLVIGFTFLFVSGLVYYLFIAAWLNVFLLLGYNFWVQKGIGLIAVLAGGFYLYEAFGSDPNACKVTDHNKRQRVLKKMHNVLVASAWPLMLLGVSVLAVSVNMIELVCTAGLPAVFTQILASNEVSTLARYGYLLIYILMYMLDDFTIFVIALVTMQASGLTTKYRRLTLIMGGGLMYCLGVLLIFFPDALIFSL